MSVKILYRSDDERWSAPAYTHRDYRGIAFYVLGWEEGEQEDDLSGMVVARMVGDDRDWVFDPELLKPLKEKQFCSSCGQIGCTHGG